MVKSNAMPGDFPAPRKTERPSLFGGCGLLLRGDGDMIEIAGGGARIFGI
jgi:hypothetical protein